MFFTGKSSDFARGSASSCSLTWVETPENEEEKESNLLGQPYNNGVNKCAKSVEKEEGLKLEQGRDDSKVLAKHTYLYAYFRTSITDFWQFSEQVELIFRTFRTS